MAQRYRLNPRFQWHPLGSNFGVFVSQSQLVPITDYPAEDVESLVVDGFTDLGKLESFLVKRKVFQLNPAKTKIHFMDGAGGKLEVGELLDPERFSMSSLDDCDISVLTIESFFQEGLRGLIEQAPKPLLLWCPFGDGPIIGPLFTDSKPYPVCFDCVRASMERNQLCDLGEGPLEFPAHLDKSAFKAATGFLEQELLKITQGSIALCKELLLVSPQKRQTQLCALYPSPNCPKCAEGKKLSYQLKNVSFIDNSLRSVDPEVSHKRLSSLVNPITGILTKIIPHGSRLSCATIGMSALGMKSGFLFDNVAYSMGKGKTELHSELSCIGEAVERMTMTHFGKSDIITGSSSQLCDDYELVELSKLEAFSDSQRSAWEKVDKRLQSTVEHFVPPSLEADDVIDWKKAYCLDRGSEVLVPACAIFRRDLLSDEKHFCIANSTGMASGECFEEAIIHATLELLERDAVGMWWYNRLNAPEIPLERAQSDYLKQTLRYFNERNRDVRLLYLRTDWRAHNIAAISWDRDSKSNVTIGFGSGFQLQATVDRAVGELAQTTVFNYQNRDALNSVLELERDGWLQSSQNLSLDDMLVPDFEFLNSNAAFEHLLEDARRIGLDIYWSDLKSEFPLKVVKVFIPGLNKHYPRFGNTRLFDLPVRLGYLDQPKREEEMNPMTYQSWKKNMFGARK